MFYDFKNIEKKWQKRWQEEKAFCAEQKSDKEKFFALIEFPYPSGAGLHIGHPRPYTALDIVSRKKRMEGKNVLFPIGWDAFGLPSRLEGLPPGWQETEKYDYLLQHSMLSLGKGSGPNAPCLTDFQASPTPA